MTERDKLLADIIDLLDFLLEKGFAEAPGGCA
jgi:hypothetical protein